MSTASNIYDEQQIFGPFDDFIDLECLDKHPILSTSPKSHEVIRSLSGGETTGLFVTINGRCTNRKCGCETNLKVWVELGVERKDGSSVLLNVLNTVLVDGEDLIVDAHPGFYRGIDIATGLNNLYLRWWYLGADIFVICPFIGKSELKFFDEIGLQILKTYNSMMISRPINNPFKKIITRKNAQHNFKKAKTSELIYDYLHEIDNNMVFLDGYPGSGLEFVFSGSLFEVENIPRKGYHGQENEHLKFANYFHGKLYGACFNGMSEVVVTSYNYTSVESLQLESLSFVRSSEENLRRQIEIFENDQHMAISPVEMP